MASIHFLIRGKKELSTIYVRVRDGRNTDLTVSTGYVIEPENWSEKKGEVKQTAKNSEKLNLKISLNKLNSSITEQLNNTKAKGGELNRDWLELAIKKAKGVVTGDESLFLSDLMARYREKLAARPQKVSSTIRGFNTGIGRLIKFEAHKKKRFLVHEVDLTFYDSFVQFFRNEGLSDSSIGATIKQIKTVCRDAKDRGIKINEQVLSRKFAIIQEKTDFITLDEMDLDRIRKFTGADYLENARDWLIIGCWTACRVNDLMRLTKDNIHVNQKGQRFIRYTQSKTGQTVDIPLHPIVNEVLERLGGFPRPISDVKFNVYIKEVCKHSGLEYEVYGSRVNPTTKLKEVGMFPKWQLVRSHICRRSFATNNYSKLPNKVIMKVTGHATEKLLLNYIGEVENDHFDDFMNVWNNSEPAKDKMLNVANV